MRVVRYVCLSVVMIAASNLLAETCPEGCLFDAERYHQESGRSGQLYESLRKIERNGRR